MFLIVGLGNPGGFFRKNRHNAGFMALDFFSTFKNCIWKHKIKLNADIANSNIKTFKVVLCKPTTFMNLSGKAVLLAMSYYKIKQENLIVIHDDIDLLFGKIKCKLGGSNGGHNGLKSIDEKVGYNYYRVRIGIGRPSFTSDIASYVLTDFSKAELFFLYKKYEVIFKNIHFLLSSDLENFKKKIS